MYVCLTEWMLLLLLIFQLQREQELADVDREQRQTADLEKSAQSAQRANRDLQKAVAAIGEASPSVVH